MAIKLVAREYSPFVGGYIDTYVLDAESEAANLPVSPTGSTAIVAAQGGGVYMVNASGKWVKQ